MKKFILIIMLFTFSFSTYQDISLYSTDTSATSIGNIGEFLNKSSCIFYNPASLYLQKNNLTLSSYKYFEDINYYSFSGKINDFGIGYIGLRAIDYETALDINQNVVEGSSFLHTNSVFFISKSFNLKSSLLGISIKYYNYGAKNQTADGFNADIGFIYKLSEDLMISNTIRNILNFGQESINWSTKRVESLPTEATTSLMYKNGSMACYVKGSFNPSTDKMLFSVGGTYYLGPVSLSGGAFEKNDLAGSKIYYSCGLNVELLPVVISYAMIPNTMQLISETTHNFSFTYFL